MKFCFKCIPILFENACFTFAFWEENSPKAAPFSKGRTCPVPVWFIFSIVFALLAFQAVAQGTGDEKRQTNPSALPQTNRVVSTHHNVDELISDLSSSVLERRLTAQRRLYQKGLMNPKTEGKLRIISFESPDSNMVQMAQDILDRMTFTRMFNDVKIYDDDYEELKNSHSFDFKETISNSKAIQNHLIVILYQGRDEAVYILSRIKLHESTERYLVRMLYYKKKLGTIGIRQRSQEVLLQQASLNKATLMDLITALQDSNARPLVEEILLAKASDQAQDIIFDMQRTLVVHLPNPDTRSSAEKILHSIAGTFVPQAQHYLITLLYNYQFLSENAIQPEDRQLQHTIEELLKSMAQKNLKSAHFIQKELTNVFFVDYLVITDNLVNTLIAVLMEISKKYGLTSGVIEKLKKSTMSVDPYMRREVENLLSKDRHHRRCEQGFASR